MSPGPVQCKCPVRTADRTGITLTACLKHMAHWQKIHISSRASLFGISQNRTKPQIPLGRAFGFFIQWLRSNTSVCGTWRLLLPAWQAGIPHASSRNTGNTVRSAQPNGLQALEILKTMGQLMFWHDFLFSLVFFGFLFGFACGFFPYPFLQG